MTIVGGDPSLVVTEADDDFHPPTSDDPTWIETAWFPFWIPEIAATVHVRLWWRPNAGQQGGAVTAWRGANQMIAYDGWTEDFTGFGDLRRLDLANGLELHCRASLSTYTIRHQSRRVDVDIEFLALTPAHAVSPDESPGMFLGHFEQAGRVVGSVRIGDTTHAIDCGSVRDRSWGPRTMRPGVRLGNAHGTTVDGRAFFVYVNPDESGDERITSGYWHDGSQTAQIIAGARSTTYDGDFPSAVIVEATDALGRTLFARGRCANRQAVDAGHDLYAVLNLVEWNLGVGDSAWGENHDIWSKADWLAAGRSALPSR
jgi:hypothetical protein